MTVPPKGWLQIAQEDQGDGDESQLSGLGQKYPWTKPKTSLLDCHNLPTLQDTAGPNREGELPEDT